MILSRFSFPCSPSALCTVFGERGRPCPFALLGSSLSPCPVSPCPGGGGGGERHRGRYTHRAHRVVHRARTALRFLPTLSCIFHIFSGWQGRGGLRGKHTTTEASTPSSSPMVVVGAHTPCQGRAVGRGRRGCRTLRYGRSTEEPSAPQGAQACGAVSNVSCFAVLNALVSRFGVLLLGVPKPRK